MDRFDNRHGQATLSLEITAVHLRCQASLYTQYALSLVIDPIIDATQGAKHYSPAVDEHHQLLQQMLQTN